MRMYHFTLAALLSAMLCMASCGVRSQELPYDFRQPDQQWQLPQILFEVSGLTALDDGSFACVQDEKGTVFIYDPSTNGIKTQYDFHLDGDYEGITEAHGSFYILRSDGMLYEVHNINGADFDVKMYNTRIPAKDNEGLCYDPVHDRLLIASKSKPENEPKDTPIRVVYGFDLTTRELSADPVFAFNVDALEAYAEKNKIALPVKTKKDGSRSEPRLKFKTSAIAVHPLTHELYLLSAKDHFLFVFDLKGKLKRMVPLDDERYNKAEGITFYKNGDMLITNEGDKDNPEKTATALMFRYKKSGK